MARLGYERESHDQDTMAHNSVCIKIHFNVGKQHIIIVRVPLRAFDPKVLTTIDVPCTNIFVCFQNLTMTV